MPHDHEIASDDATPYADAQTDAVIDGNVATHASADTNVWRPDGSLTIYRAAESHAAVVAALAHGISVVDLAGVDRIDTAGCQVLLKMAGDARARGLDWRVSGVRPGVLATIRRLGCDVPFALDAASGGRDAPDFEGRKP